MKTVKRDWPKRSKVSWKSMAAIFRRRFKAYWDDGKDVETREHRAFVLGKSDAYANLARDTQSFVTRSIPHELVLDDLQRLKQSASERAREGTDVVESNYQEGMAQAYREAIKDVYAATGMMPYLQFRKGARYQKTG